MNRWLWMALGTSSAAAVAVSVLPDPATENVAAVSGASSRESARDPARPPNRAAPSEIPGVILPPAARAPWPDADPAASRAWAPAPPPAQRAATAVPQPASAAASAPAAPPPFPYAWIGQLETEGRVQIYLSSPQRLVVAYEGDVLDTRWRIDTVSAGRLQVTWLPTDTAVAVAAR